MSVARRRIVVLASGGGSNLSALLDFLDALGERRAADVVAVASDRPAAGALERARARGLEAVVLATARHPDGEALESLLDRTEPDLVALAGYLRLVPAAVVARFHGRIVNVHPALLPGFGGPGMYGARVHEAVIAAGVHVTGPTVHFVDEVFDRGPIIAQWPVPVLPDDTPQALAARVLAAEHALYPRAIHALATGAVTLHPSGRAEWRRDAMHASPQFAAVAADPPSAAGAMAIDALYPDRLPSPS